MPLSGLNFRIYILRSIVLTTLHEKFQNANIAGLILIKSSFADSTQGTRIQTENTDGLFTTVAINVGIAVIANANFS